MTEEMALEQAFAKLLETGKEANAEVSWIEIVHNLGERRDMRFGTTSLVSTWQVSLEVFGDNAEGLKRFRHVLERATHLHQAINRAIVAIKGPKNMEPKKEGERDGRVDQKPGASDPV